MRIHKCFSITALIAIISVFVFTPLLDATAEGNTQTVTGSFSSFYCTPPILPPWFSSPAPNDSRLVCSFPVGLPGVYCSPKPEERSYPLHVSPNAVLHVEVTWTASAFCSSVVIAYSNPACSLLRINEWICNAPASGDFILTVIGAGDPRFTFTITEVEEPEPPPVVPPDPEIQAGLQRINEPASTPYIIYVPTAERAAAENTQFIDIWRLDENAIGQPLLYISKEALLALPEYPAENLLIATSPDELVNVYKLTTGEYQVNLGPLADGKVYTTIFDAIPPTQITHSTWVVPSE